MPSLRNSKCFSNILSNVDKVALRPASCNRNSSLNPPTARLPPRLTSY